MYYIYILRCNGGELYTGITSDIMRRLNEHSSQSKKCAKYTRSHKITALEGLWTAKNRSLASKLEHRIKKLPRSKKLKLIENPCLVSNLAEDNEFFNPITIKISNLDIKNPLV